jgi:DNA-binding NarL/FixJ family response regulator
MEKYMSGSNKRSILVVDDDELTRRLVRIILKDLDGLEIVEFKDGPSALATIDKQDIKVIMTDIIMPGMDGVEFISAVRGKGLDTPVVFISGHADKEIILKAVKLSAFDFIEKPFRKEDLLPTVKRALATHDLGILPKLQSLNLNSTQIKVLEMLMKGLSNKEIGIIVNLSEQGVKYHIGNLFKRFETSDRVELRGKIWAMLGVHSFPHQKPEIFCGSIDNGGAKLA